MAQLETTDDAAAPSPHRQRNTRAHHDPIPIKPNLRWHAGRSFKALPNWVCWRYLPPKSDGKKWREKSRSSRMGVRPTRLDRSTWSTFESVLCGLFSRRVRRQLASSLMGRSAKTGSAIAGWTLTGCIGPADKIQPVQSLALAPGLSGSDACTERSPSGTGLHCIARAKPLDRTAKVDGVEVVQHRPIFHVHRPSMLGGLR